MSWNRTPKGHEVSIACFVVFYISLFVCAAANMSSTRELFGDDSSSSEDEKEEESKQQSGDNDDAAADKADKAGVDDVPAGAPTTAAADKKENDNDDDDDDDDVEFDGQQGITGLSSTTMAGSKTAASGGAAPMDIDSEAADKAEEKQDERTMIVQEFTDRPTGKEIYMTRLPNLMGIQTAAFDPETYSPQAEEDEFGPQSAYNLVRWRYGKGDGAAPVRESNTRLVKWDNGSWTLHVGTTEAFEVDIVDSSDASSGFAGLNGYLYLSQKASYRENNNNNTTTPAGTVLECLGPVTSRMTVRPSSLQSEAHKSLTVAVRQQTTKRARIAEFTTTQDPEKIKEERIKIKADLEKAMRKQQQSSSYIRSGGGGGGGHRRPRMSRSYLEEDDRDFDTTNIRAMKKGIYDRDMDDFGDDYDEDDEEEDETFHRVRPKKGKAAAAKDDKEDDEEEDDNDGAFGGDDDDDDDEVVRAVKQGTKRPAQSLFDDDSD